MSGLSAEAERLKKRQGIEKKEKIYKRREKGQKRRRKNIAQQKTIEIIEKNSLKILFLK